MIGRGGSGTGVGAALRFAVVLLLGGGLALAADRAGATTRLLALTGLRPFGRSVRLVPPASPGVPLERWRAAHPGSSLLLVVGQSQAANFAERDVATTDSVWTLLDDRVVRATEPLPGAEGEGGSLWPLVARGSGDSLVVAAVAVGATTMADWAPGGPGWSLVVRRLEAAVTAGLPVRAVVLMVGEADAVRGTNTNAWRTAFARFDAALRSHGVVAPIVMVLETRCFAQPPSDAIRRAQRAGVDGRSVQMGPDLDRLDHRFRWDGCHLSREGVGLAATALGRVVRGR
jgi:hypothetical protein